MGNTKLSLSCIVSVHSEILSSPHASRGIVDVSVVYIRKLDFLSNRLQMFTANYSPVFCSYFLGPLDLKSLSKADS